MTRLEAAERRLALSVYEAKGWDKARLLVRGEMDELGIGVEDLVFGLRESGIKVHSSTVSRWLRGEGGGPNPDELFAIIRLLAYWPRGRFLSTHLLGDVLRPRFSPRAAYEMEAA